MSRNLRKKKRHHMGNLAPLVPQKRLIKYYQICKNTSESVLQTILKLCNITFTKLYLLLNFDQGANFCKIRRLTDAVLQFRNIDRD